MDLKVTISTLVDGSEKTWDLEFRQELIRIGRHSSNDVQIPDMQVSAEHARILVEEESISLVDLGSATGTIVDGKKVGPHRRIPLEGTTELRIAEYRVLIETLGEELDESTSEKTAMVAMRMVKEVLGSLTDQEDEQPFFEVLNDDEKGARLDLNAEEGEYIVGREKSCELILRHWSISRKHVRIHRVQDTVTAEDLGSKNGTLHNGKRVEKGDFVNVKDGDVIAVGHTELRFKDPGASILDSLDATPTPVTNLNELGVEVKSAKQARAPAPQDSPKPRREREESSVSDYLPLILGGLLVVAVIVVALFLFVL